MKKKNIVLLVYIFIIILIIGGLCALWYRGDSELSSVYIDINTMKQSPVAPRLLYRGIKFPWADGSIVLFKRYYSIVHKDNYTGLTTTVLYNKDGYSPFSVFYESGQIAAQGYCMVESEEPNGQILHDTDDVKEAIYYVPDGTDVSKVKDGTGIISLHFPDGLKHWELELDNYERKRVKMWLKDGTLKLDKTY